MGIATTSTNAAPKQLSDQNSQGTLMGASVTDPIGFYGVTTTVIQATGSTSAFAAVSTQTAVTVSSASSTGAYGYGTSTIANQILILTNEMRRVLVALGFMRGS